MINDNNIETSGGTVYIFISVVTTPRMFCISTPAAVLLFICTRVSRFVGYIAFFGMTKYFILLRETYHITTSKLLTVNRDGRLLNTNFTHLNVTIIITLNHTSLIRIYLKKRLFMYNAYRIVKTKKKFKLIIYELNRRLHAIETEIIL